MNDALWPNPAVIQQHYTKDWTRHPVYILDHQGRHPLYNREAMRRHESGPSALYQAIARQRQYPDQYGSLPYDPSPPTRTRPCRPPTRAIGRCRVTYTPSATTPPPSRPPTEPVPDNSKGSKSLPPGQSMAGARPSPGPTPNLEPETVSLLHPTGKFAEKVAGVRRLREWDEKIPQEHLPTHRPAWRISHRFIPWPTIVKRCRECVQPWPCHPLRANLQRRYGGDITTRLHALSTKKLRTRADQRSPTATRHRAWTPGTWYGKPKPE